MDKSAKTEDPFAKREAANYANPIPSREYILRHLEQLGEPVDHNTLCYQLELSSDEQIEALRRRLIAMSRDGQIISNRRGAYGLADHMELMKGRIQGNKDGYGFFIPEDGSGDLFLSAREMQRVFDGDTVLARMSGIDRRGRKEGMVAEVLQRKSNTIVGRYYQELEYGVVVADNRRISQEILIPHGESRRAEDGQFVVAEITTYPNARRKAVARVVEILGDVATPGLEIEVAVRSHDIPHVWPREAEQQAREFAEEVPEGENKGRIDLRKLPLVTIDGEDAKDFDDAVYAEAVPKAGWKLYVAIADVSHYVAPGSALDDEASNRGNSVYFPGHVIPMLPEKLSNGLCSLKPEVDRLVMVCEMTIDKTGVMKDYVFYEAIMHSHARLTYSEVADMLESATHDTAKKIQQSLIKRHEALFPHLQTLYGLFEALRSNRTSSGALDFDTIETRIVFGENKKIREIIPVVRNNAHRLIEECMLRANVAAAKLLEASDLPALYRIHEGPNPTKLDNLREYLKGMGLNLGGGDKPEPEHYQKVLQQIEGRADAHLLQTVLIRSLMQAVYQPENLGHFGLGYDAYTHFTSPIRRYPDLLVHRAIRFLIRNKKQDGPNKGDRLLRVRGAKRLAKSAIYPYDKAAMQQLGDNCSMTERRADAASYDVIDWLKCEYIQDRVGDDFTGTVTAVTSFGLFVELNDIFVEGLVHITELQNDYYHFDPVRQTLEGEHSHKTYHLGDIVQVKVVRVSLDEKKIDLHMQGDSGRAAKPDRRRKNSASSAKNAGGESGRKSAKSSKNASKTARTGSKRTEKADTAGNARGAGKNNTKAAPKSSTKDSAQANEGNGARNSAKNSARNSAKNNAKNSAKKAETSSVKKSSATTGNKSAKQAATNTVKNNRGESTTANSGKKTAAQANKKSPSATSKNTSKNSRKPAGKAANPAAKANTSSKKTAPKKTASAKKPGATKKSETSSRRSR